MFRVYVRRLGGQSAYLGAVGTDDFGKQMCAALQEKGVDVSHVQILPGKTAFTHVERINGERVLAIMMRASWRIFRLRQADFDFLKGYKSPGHRTVGAYGKSTGRRSRHGDPRGLSRGRAPAG